MPTVYFWLALNIEATRTFRCSGLRAQSNGQLRTMLGPPSADFP